MNWTPKIIATLAVASAVIVLALWFGSSAKPSPKPVPPNPVLDPVTQFFKTDANGFFSPRTRPKAGNTNGATATNSVTGTNQIVNWEEAIDEILRDEKSEPNAKAKKLLEMFPRIPETGQAEAAQHIANLLADEDYAPFAAYFTSTNTAVEVQEVIMADLLGRPNSLKLPVLLEAARTPQHAKATEAKELLELYLEKDYGPDWEVWQKKLEVWLKANPD